MLAGDTGRPRPTLTPAELMLLAAAVRFLHFALFEGSLLSLHYYLVDAAVCLMGTRGVSQPVRRGSLQFIGAIRELGAAGAQPGRGVAKYAPDCVMNG